MGVSCILAGDERGTNSMVSNWHYAELAKTWLTIAGDLADLESQLRADPDKKAG